MSFIGKHVKRAAAKKAARIRQSNRELEESKRKLLCVFCQGKKELKQYILVHKVVFVCENCRPIFEDMGK